MPRSARKLEIREANESRILAAAERIFAQHGYRGATTERIAAEAHLPKAHVHYYFKTKANLYRRVLEAVLDDWMSAATAFDQSDDPAEALENYVTAKMAFSRKRPYGSRVWAKEIMGGAPVIQKFLGTTLKDWLKQRERIIQRWIRNGQMAPVNPRALLYMIWAATQHYADFEKQMQILNDGKAISDGEYRAKTRQVVRLVLGSAGVDRGGQRRPIQRRAHSRRILERNHGL